MTPLISVIIPVYNGQEYLRGCVESIVNQTYQNIEIIIINDGSTDGTDKICEELQKQYSFVLVTRLNDRGVSVARNTGMSLAKGEFITFVDADDRILPDMLSTLYQTLTQENSDVAGCRFFTWHTREELLDQIQSNGLSKDICNFNRKSYNSRQFLEKEILMGNSRCWSKLYKRTAIASVNFREGLSIGEDMLFLADILSDNTQFTEIDYPGYGYYQNPKGAMYRPFTPSYMDQITCWELLMERISAIEEKASQTEKADLATAESALLQKGAAHLVMGIMLTVGKLASLSHKKRLENNQYIQICQDKLKKVKSDYPVQEGLSTGYRLKMTAFTCMPTMYLTLYHLLHTD